MKSFSTTFVMAMFCFMSFAGDGVFEKKSLVEEKTTSELILETDDYTYHYYCRHRSHMNCDGPLTSLCGCSESTSYALLSTCEAEA